MVLELVSLISMLFGVVMFLLNIISLMTPEIFDYMLNDCEINQS